MNLPIILASSSPRRKELLAKIKIIPDQIISPNIDETQLKHEKPHDLAMRLSHTKAMKVAEKFDNAVIIAADTVCVSRGKILDKTQTDDDVRHHLSVFSGGRLRVYTAVCVIHKTIDNTKIIKKLVQTLLKFKRLTKQEIDFYCQLKEGLNIGGGCAIEGYGEAFIKEISGSCSNVSGLPLYETRTILESLNIKPKIHTQCS